MKIVEKSGKVISDVVDDTMMLCETSTVSFFRLNKTGAAIWDLCDGKSVDQIVDTIATSWPKASRKDIGREVANFIDLLASEDLITLKDVAKEVRRSG